MGSPAAGTLGWRAAGLRLIQAPCAAIYSHATSCWVLLLLQLFMLNPKLRVLACPQERAAELAAHEESLESWKAQFKAEALRQIGERERLLGEWQGRLERRAEELEDLQRSAEVGRELGYRVGAFGKVVAAWGAAREDLQRPAEVGREAGWFQGWCSLGNCRKGRGQQWVGSQAGLSLETRRNNMQHSPCGACRQHLCVARGALQPAGVAHDVSPPCEK